MIYPALYDDVLLPPEPALKTETTFHEDVSILGTELKINPSAIENDV